MRALHVGGAASTWASLAPGGSCDDGSAKVPLLLLHLLHLLLLGWLSRIFHFLSRRRPKYVPNPGAPQAGGALEPS